MASISAPFLWFPQEMRLALDHPLSTLWRATWAPDRRDLHRPRWKAGARDLIKRTSFGRRAALGLSAAALLVGTVAGPTFAADQVTQAVTAGSRTASVANLALGSASYSHIAQTSAGSMTLTADDSTGSNAGWNVTIETSDFVWSAGSGGASSGADIPATNFALTSAAAPTSTAGQAVDATNGPKIPTTTPVGSLDSARKTVQADSGYGNGTYTHDLDVSLSVPARSAAGTYTGTLTTTIAAAP
jgi:hypothetical protein